MGTAILPIDLSTAIVGTTGNINIPTVTSEEGYHFLLFNESGCGLKLQFLDSGDTDSVPAGAWRKYPLAPGEERVTWSVVYILPNAPVSLILGTLYRPDEEVPDVGILGNSPISIGGSVSTTNINALSNETSVLGTKIIDIGTLTIGDLLDIFNDHFLWQVQQSGVAHQVLKGQTSGNPLQIGQSGDISEVLGQLLIDQLLHVAGNLTVDGTSLLTGIATLSAIPVINAAMKLNPTGLVDNGSTSGNATLYQLLVGNVKIVVIEQSGPYRNAGSAIVRALPTAFTKSALIIATGCAGFALLLSGSAISVN